MIYVKLIVRENRRLVALQERRKNFSIILFPFSTLMCELIMK